MGELLNKEQLDAMKGRFEKMPPYWNDVEELLALLNPEEGDDGC